MRMRMVLLIVFLLVPCLCLAQPSKRTAVAVTHTGEDQVGRSFAFALKEAIRRSQSFVLVDDTLTGPRIVVHLVSVDSYASQMGVSSAIGISIVYDSMETPGNGIFISSSVSSCGRDHAESCAKNDVLPSIDREVSTCGSPGRTSGRIYEALNYGAISNFSRKSPKDEAFTTNTLRCQISRLCLCERFGKSNPGYRR